MERNRIEELIDFQGINVVVLGDVMLDKYITGGMDRISPEAPVPVVNLESREVRLGGAANVAKNVANLGAKVSLTGIIGNDENGLILRKLLKQSDGIQDQLIIDESRKTTSKTRILSQNQHLMRIDEEDQHYISAEITEKVIEKISIFHNEEKVDILILQDYNKGFFSPLMISAIIKWAKANNVKTCVDPKKNNVSLFKEVDLFKPNLKEFSEILNVQVDVEILSLARNSKNLIEKQQCKLLLLTLGGDGVFLSNGNQDEYVQTNANSIVDVSGAGDTVISLAALLYFKSKATLAEMGQLANYAGAAVCNVPGVGVINKEMIMKYALPTT